MPGVCLGVFHVKTPPRPDFVAEGPGGGRSDFAAALAPLADRYGLDDHATRSLTALATHLAHDRKAPTAVHEPSHVLDRHIADSLAGLEVEAIREARTLADLGSGAGLPGLVLAAALPGCEVHTVESQQSKCAYTASLLAPAALTNVRVVCSRAEQWDAGFEANDVVVARALAAQPVVLEYAAPLVKLGGQVVEWRGRRDRAEEERAASAASALGLERVEVRRVNPFASAEERHLHVFQKTAPTPPGFPRRPGVAVRRPLGG